MTSVSKTPAFRHMIFASNWELALYTNRRIVGNFSCSVLLLMSVIYDLFDLKGGAKSVFQKVVLFLIYYFSPAERITLSERQNGRCVGLLVIHNPKKVTVLYQVKTLLVVQTCLFIKKSMLGAIQWQTDYLFTCSVCLRKLISTQSGQLCWKLTCRHKCPFILNNKLPFP